MGKTLNCNQWCAVSFGALFSFSQVQDVACVGVQIAWFMCAFKICVASCVGGQCVWVWDLNPNNRIGSGHLRPILFTTTAKFLLFYFLVVDLFSLPILDLPACLLVTLWPLTLGCPVACLSLFPWDFSLWSICRACRLRLPPCTSPMAVRPGACVLVCWVDGWFIIIIC